MSRPLFGGQVNVLELSTALELLNEQYLYGYEAQAHYDTNRGFGTGMFHFRKPL